MHFVFLQRWYNTYYESECSAFVFDGGAKQLIVIHQTPLSIICICPQQLTCRHTEEFRTFLNTPFELNG